MSVRTGAQTKGAPHARISFRTIQSASVLILLVVLCIFSSIQSDTFLTWRNLVNNLLTNASYVGIIACGMTLVMIAGGFDLSVGSIAAVCNAVAVILLRDLAGAGPWLAISVAVAGTVLAGTLLGVANGALVSYVGVNPFVTTLSTMLVFRGIALVITRGGQSIEVPLNLAETFRQFYWGRVPLFGSDVYRVSVPILVFLGVFAVLHCLLRYTRYGHYVRAVGGNETAAWLAGINAAGVKAVSYTICGFACAVAALLYTGMSNTAEAAGYHGLEMIVIAAVIVGGTPLGGGSGSLWCTLNGLLLLSVIENLLIQFGIDEEYRNIIRGMIILVVVAVDVAARKARAKGRG
jgi:ribose transport system permease protein